MEPLRRLSDRIIEAHSQACFEGKVAVAEALLAALETDLSAIGGGATERRRDTAMIEDVYHRHRAALAAAKAGRGKSNP